MDFFDCGEEYFEAETCPAMDFVDEMDMVPLCPCGADPGPKGDLPGKLMWLTMDSGAGKSCTSKKLASRFNITP